MNQSESIPAKTSNLSKNHNRIKKFITTYLIMSYLEGDAEKRKPTLIGHVFLTAGLLSLVLISHIIIYITMGSIQKEWISCPSDQASTPLGEDFIKTASSAEKIRLKQQYATIQNLTAKHCYIMTFFYKHYILCLSMGSTAALITTLCIFFLTKEGWEKSNNALINISITAFGVTTFYLNLTQLFQQHQNLATSQNLYASYLQLHNTFSSSLALVTTTNTSSTKAISQPPATTPQLKSATSSSQPLAYAAIIQNTDLTLNSLGYIKLGFDPTPVISLQDKANSFLVQNSAKPIPNPAP